MCGRNGGLPCRSKQSSSNRRLPGRPVHGDLQAQGEGSGTTRHHSRTSPPTRLNERSPRSPPELPGDSVKQPRVRRGSRDNAAPRGGRFFPQRRRSASTCYSEGAMLISGAPPAASLLGQLRPGRVNKLIGPPPEQSLTECRQSCWLVSSAPPFLRLLELTPY
ncbi:hypothetical protein NDU88_001481 [Pleurodeles waltl]|uniref:Uncharacterized protein n=1 Tax=Pleurodeles waltl TaxID=8319 RepID=A0AAV7KSS0_PLEWA|nr:hypothetical protein NDU88_001481 [Pleurodeles waltl]